MKTIEVIETIKWIEKQFGPTALEFLMGKVRELRNAEKSHSSIQKVIKAAHELTEGRIRLMSHPLAGRILVAFHLEALLTDEFAIKISNAAIGSGHAVSSADALGIENTFSMMSFEISRFWRGMISCVEPIEALTIPKRVRSETDFDEILTMEIFREEGTNIEVKELISILQNLEELYDNLTQWMGRKETEKLNVIYSASGSSVRFDITGAAEVIKAIKQLFFEGWSLVRHRKADELKSNCRAVLDGLTALEKVKKAEKNGSMELESCRALRTRIEDNMINLFKNGALPREIKQTEVVSNVELVFPNSQKLLVDAASNDSKNESIKIKAKPIKRKRVKEVPKSDDFTEFPSATE